MRTFIAIKVEPEASLLEKLTSLKRELSDEPVKWVDERNLHLTLKFLGETSPVQAEQVKNALSSIAGLQQPVSFVLSGLGFFKSRGMPRVLFVDIHETENLKELASRIENLLLPVGFPKEERPYNPHLTLCRIKYLKDKKLFFQAVEANRFTSDKITTVKEVIFFESRLTAEGPVYHELAKFKLSSTVES